MGIYAHAVCTVRLPLLYVAPVYRCLTGGHGGAAALYKERGCEMKMQELLEVVQTQGFQLEDGESILFIANTPDGVYSSLIGNGNDIKESLVHTLLAEKDTTELLVSAVNAYHTSLRYYFRDKNADRIKARVQSLPFMKKGGEA